VDAHRFGSLWRSLAPVGQAPDGPGYLRYAFSPADMQCREWFIEEALDRELAVETDGNGNLWAWWGEPAAGDAVLTGSHFDSVPHGGGYDGPLGIVSAFLAVDVLRERGDTPRRPIAVVAFAEEEGSRFGLACLGSRLLTGAVTAEEALRLTDRDGVTLAEALAAADLDPAAVGPDPQRLAAVGSFVELHIEQGRGLTGPVGVASAIWPHGRWRLDVTGEPNHAGTTAWPDRHDPILTLARVVLTATEQARTAGARATVGRILVEPNATNAIAASVTAWLDLRAANQSTLDKLVEVIDGQAKEQATVDGTVTRLTAESRSPGIEFDPALRERIVATLGDAPVLATAAGHDAGILSAHVRTAMLFVRNPTGVSHAPGEHATDEDCAAGVAALADVLTELACR
jgi:beta-ureidopropionase / N-carbamoyl-L-amino-acid hydrolase